MNIKETLFALSSQDAAGSVRDAADLAYDLLKEHCECKKNDNLTVFGFLKGESDYTIMLDAHIDQIAAVVTNIDDNGFLTVSNAGSIDLRALPSRRVTVHAKQKISGVFCSTPPHLAKSSVEYDDINKLRIDTSLGKKAKEIISLGDVVTFAGETKELLGDKVSGRSFDDRAGVACLIEIAKRLKGEKLPFNVAFVLSDSEELGLRGARTASFKVSPDEAIAVDVSFGDGIGIASDKCGKLGDGAMIGISPYLDRKMSARLIDIAKQNEIPYQTEVMAGSTGTNADAISVNKTGVRTCTVSIPLRNMHTEVEVLDLKDLDSVCDLVCRYILCGGVMND